MIGKVNREIGMTNKPSSLLACLQTQLLLRVIDRCTANYNLELQKAGQPETVKELKYTKKVTNLTRKYQVQLQEFLHHTLSYR